MQSCLAEPEYLPTGHFASDTEPCVETKEPAFAGVQIVDPDFGANDPGSQSLHELWPASLLILPAAQGVHVEAASLDANEPG